MIIHYFSFHITHLTKKVYLHETGFYSPRLHIHIALYYWGLLQNNHLFSNHYIFKIITHTNEWYMKIITYSLSLYCMHHMEFWQLKEICQRWILFMQFRRQRCLGSFISVRRLSFVQVIGYVTVVVASATSRWFQGFCLTTGRAPPPWNIRICRYRNDELLHHWIGHAGKDELVLLPCPPPSHLV